MPTVADIAAHIERLAPLDAAEPWDNVGLLVGDRAKAANRVMTCLTLTPATVAEAVDDRAELVVVHHPLPFHAVRRITTDTTTGRLLWRLIGAGISIHSAHTAFDSAPEGINQQLSTGLGLVEIQYLIGPVGTGNEGLIGSGRWGVALPPVTMSDLVRRAKEFLSLKSVQVVGDDVRLLRRIAVACGSGASFLTAAQETGCECLVTGEAKFHSCLEAEATGICLILVGHFASERFAAIRMADELAQGFPGLTVWASQRERDPLRVA